MATKLQPAGLLRRLPAIAVDALPALLVVWILYAVGVFDSAVLRPPEDWFWSEWLLNYWLDAPTVLLLPPATFLLLAIMTCAGAEAVLGRSLGGRLLGLRVLDKDGFEVGGGRVLLRALGSALNVATLGLGYAWIVVSRYRRGLHDILAGTVVVRDD
ncbi:MAG: RDD family protein [Myxococcota bacterium]